MEDKVFLMVYTRILNENIEKERARTSYYAYSDEDRAILDEMFEEINSKFSTDFHYLAEIAAFRIQGSGEIFLRYIWNFRSETIRGYMISQLVEDKIKNCDQMLLDLYSHFRSSKEYISPPNKPNPAHIYVRYDNAFAKINLGGIADRLMEIVKYPRDACYLPLTMRRLSCRKVDTMKEILLRYLISDHITPQDIGLPTQSLEYSPSLSTLQRQVCFSAIHGLRYYPSEDVYSQIEQIFLTSTDKDIQMAAQKTLKVLETKLFK